MSRDFVDEHFRPISTGNFDESSRNAYVERAVHADETDIFDYQQVFGVDIRNEWKGLKILDIGGTPNGMFARQANDAGLDLVTYNPRGRLGITQPLSLLNDFGQMYAANEESKTKTVAGYVQQMPFADNTFDREMSFASIPVYLPNFESEYRNTLIEIIRTLKPNGQALLSPIMENVYKSETFRNLLKEQEAVATFKFIDRGVGLMPVEDGARPVRFYQMEIAKI